MGGEPNKRRLKWFTKPSLGALGRLRQRKPQSSKTSSSDLGSQWPTLGDVTSSRSGGQPPRWNPAVPGGSDLTGAKRSPRTLWGRFQSASRGKRVGLAVGAGGLVLLSLISVAVLCAHMPLVASGTPTTGGSNGHGTSTTTTTATPAAPFTLTFTCASGTIRRTGKVCVHTQANATLKLTVRYCDGSHATGRDVRSSASADDNGDYTWRFDIRTRCAGPATATVTATSGGQTVTESKTFTITR